MLDKSGNVCYRSFCSRCTGCSNFIKDPYQCWIWDIIPYRVWENCFGYECEHFKSNIKIDSGSYVFRDYGDRELFPEKVFGGGKYRFNGRGERI